MNPCLERILQRILEGKEKRRIRVVIGDGFAPVPGSEIFGKPWRNLERVRVRTLKQCPPEDYLCLWWLAKMEVVDVIVTTNYDCYLEATFASDLGPPFVLNPVLGENCLPYTSYCSCAPDPKTRSLRIWKIHGSLGVAYCPATDHRLVLPARPLRNPCRSNLWKYGALSTPKTLRGWTRRKQYKHLIDAHQPGGSRDCFARLIKSAKADLTDIDSVAAILVFGFSGFFDSSNRFNKWNEELTPTLLRVSHKIPVHAYITSTQDFTGRCTLWNEIKKQHPDRAEMKGSTTLLQFWQKITGNDFDNFHDDYLKWATKCGFLSYDQINQELKNAGL